MREIWDHHDNLLREVPDRPLRWSLDSIKAEAHELSEADHKDDPEGFLHEGADVVLSYMSAMKAAGFSYEVAMQAVMEKLNIVIDRAIRANLMPSDMPWQQRYETVKAEEIVVFGE